MLQAAAVMTAFSSMCYGLHGPQTLLDRVDVPWVSLLTVMASFAVEPGCYIAW